MFYQIIIEFVNIKYIHSTLHKLLGKILLLHMLLIISSSNIYDNALFMFVISFFCSKFHKKSGFISSHTFLYLHTSIYIHIFAFIVLRKGNVRPWINSSCSWHEAMCSCERSLVLCWRLCFRGCLPCHTCPMLHFPQTKEGWTSLLSLQNKLIFQRREY